MRIIRTSIIALLAFGLGACAVNPKGNNTGASSPAPVAPTNPVNSVDPGVSSLAPSEPEITLAEYDKIQKGMTYDQVVQIVGVNGEVTSSYDASDPKWSSKSYRFRGQDSFAVASVTFAGGVVESKSQGGLK